MKHIIGLGLAFFFSITSFASFQGYRLYGKVIGPTNCRQGMASIWVYRNRLLIQQMELPVGGAYEFFLRGEEFNDYEIKATHQGGCESDKLTLNLSSETKSYYYEIKLKQAGEL